MNDFAHFVNELKRGVRKELIPKFGFLFSQTAAGSDIMRRKDNLTYSGNYMKQIPNYGDERQTSWCVYCGGPPETRDHVPSKVFLDEPYPSNLPVVPACKSCNESFSMDEEYVACLIECVLAGTTDTNSLYREKIKRILDEKPKLSLKLKQAHWIKEGVKSFEFEIERMRNVILKLARGHAAFELNEPKFDEPSNIAFMPIESLTSEEREKFEVPPRALILPEVGSRAIQRFIFEGESKYSWINAQTGRYRYVTVVDIDVVIVRFVLSEYLACEVVWS